MPGFDSRNAANLMPAQAQDRQLLLEKMRAKLVTASPAAPQGAKATAPRRSKPVGGWVAMLVAVKILVVANVWVFLERDSIMSRLGYKKLAAPAMPAGSLSRDDQALYWAYAAWDPAKFKTRFGSVEEGRILVKRDAVHKAERMLREGGLGTDAEREVLALRAAAGLPALGAEPPKPRSKAKGGLRRGSKAARTQP